SIKFARINSSGQTIIEAPSEKATDHIDGAEILIVDPPRAGLHKDVVEKINEFKPKSLVYLSCNPSTQARDIALLKE
ncbi:23S rRNA (uracil-5-)-methyltransferase RumA, partial [bacterium LRH843]|nr:23S rRNA (uracil-5-)-methyltransferase RumA [bacterium LRH843]